MGMAFWTMDVPMTMSALEFRMICDELRVTQSDMGRWIGTRSQYAVIGANRAPERLVRLTVAICREFGLTIDDLDKIVQAHLNLQFPGSAPPVALAKRRRLPYARVVR